MPEPKEFPDLEFEEQRCSACVSGEETEAKCVA